MTTLERYLKQLRNASYWPTMLRLRSELTTADQMENDALTIAGVIVMQEITRNC